MPAKATVTQHGLKLTWTEETPGTSFNIYRAESAGAEVEAPYANADVGVLEYTDTNGTAAATYFYTVAAVLNGVVGPMSNEVSAVFPTVIAAPVVTISVV